MAGLLWLLELVEKEISVKILEYRYERYLYAVMRGKPENSRVKGIGAHDLCDNGAVLHD